MFCSQCGAECASTAKFCGECGAALPVQSEGRVDSTLSDGASSASARMVAPGGLGSPNVLGQASAVDQRASSAPSTSELYDLAIGDRGREYYVPRFEAFSSGGSSWGWNWPALFFTFYWLLYRKLWGSAVAYAVGSYFLLIIMGVVVGATQSAVGTTVGLALVVAYIVGPAVFANRLYYGRCIRLIERASRLSPDVQVQKAWLASKGGTSAIVAVALGLFAGISVIGILAAVALPAYQDYTVRARTSEAYVYGQQVTQAIDEQWAMSGQFPATLDDVKLPEVQSPQVRELRIAPKTFAIQIRVNKLDADHDTFELVPWLDNEKRLHWTCQTVNIPEKNLAASCRKQG